MSKAPTQINAQRSYRSSETVALIRGFLPRLVKLWIWMIEKLVKAKMVTKGTKDFGNLCHASFKTRDFKEYLFSCTKFFEVSKKAICDLSEHICGIIIV
ncbi:hypothetical protein GDO81_021925 [Engystomops pustulosus]|uniref:Uncharacterized protein n=1 Tax=Engystomops pustulosus TaxID=76066 RepID=A0AAV6ZNV2_ENGPU|nr:hypothetical protein GDO81_021925 [Engystomops pustulosus]